MNDIIDLTYPISEDMLTYPGDPKVKIKNELARLEKEELKSAYSICTLSNHHGTHVDSPAHKIPGGKTIDKFSLGKFINNAVVIDLTRARFIEKYVREIEKEDILLFLNSINFKELRDYVAYLDKNISAVIVYTGFCDEIKGQKVKGIEEKFPYFSEEAAAYVVDQVPNLEVVGIDSFSFDKKSENGAHLIFFKKDIALVETLFNLKELLDKNKDNSFELYSAPLSYLDSDAAQTRAFAVINWE